MDQQPKYDISKLKFKRRREDLQITDALIDGQVVATIWGSKKRGKTDFPVLRFAKFTITMIDQIPGVSDGEFWASHYEGAKDSIRKTLSIITA